MSEVARPSPKKRNPLVPLFFVLLLIICLLGSFIVIRANQSSDSDTNTYSATLICAECAEEGMDINLWNSPERTSVIARVPHGTTVTVLETQRGSDGRDYMLVRVATTGAEGWISESFIQR